MSDVLQLHPSLLKRLWPAFRWFKITQHKYFFFYFIQLHWNSARWLLQSQTIQNNMVFYSTKQTVQPSKTNLLPNYLTGGSKSQIYIPLSLYYSSMQIVVARYCLWKPHSGLQNEKQSCEKLFLILLINIRFFNFLISLFFFVFSCFLALSVWRWRTWLGSKGRSIVFIPNCRAPRIWSNGSASGRTNTGKEINKNQAVNFLSYTLYLYYWVLVSQYVPV